MGKRIRVQRRGRGSPTFTANTHKRVAPIRYPEFIRTPQVIKGYVKELLHEPGRGAPIALIKLEDGAEFYNIACQGLSVGQTIQIGPLAEQSVGNILPLGSIKEGAYICNIERRPRDGGAFVRSSGTYATVISHTPEGSIVKLPSGKTAVLHKECYATIGIVAAGGRIEKPFLKAGKKYYLMKAKGRVYPRTRGVAMVAACHPFGGGSHQHLGKPGTVNRNAPPGRKVGSIAARRTGKKK